VPQMDEVSTVDTFPVADPGRDLSDNLCPANYHDLSKVGHARTPIPRRYLRDAIEACCSHSAHHQTVDCMGDSVLTTSSNPPD
jgi:hypothetical protein